MSTGAEALRWDASFPVLRLTGSGTRQFLHGQTSAAIQQAPEHQLIRSCWLTATGRVQALLEVRLDPEGADVLVLCGDAEAVLTGFDRVIFPADRVKVALGGTRRRVQRLRPAPHPPQWNEDVLWPEDNTLPAAWEQLMQASQAQLEDWRISQGLPFSPAELNGDTNPLELGLGDWISLDKGCYLGQETVAKFVNHQRDHKRKGPPPEWNHGIEAGNGHQLAGGGRRRRGRVEQGGDKGEQDHKGNGKHRDGAHPERNFTVRTPKPAGFGQSVKQFLTPLRPDHQNDAQGSSSVPAVQGPVTLPSFDEHVPTDEQHKQQGPIGLNRTPCAHHVHATTRPALNVDIPFRSLGRTNLHDGLAVISRHAPPPRSD